MKKLIMTTLIIFTVFSVNISAEELNNPEKNIQIQFNFTRKIGLASNQFAVWVENEAGILVKNLFVTDFTAGKGWKKRPESLASWRRTVKDTDIDGISSATPKSGKVQLEWDIKNKNGEPVENGTYKICIEANIKWENSVLFICEIKIDDTITIGEITEKIFGTGYNKQTLITNVEIQ